MGHKILLADDSITVQKIVKLTFSDEGVEVIAVGNGELAVQKLEEMRPDLVMADVFMPGKDGYEVCEYVKTHPEMRHTPVILLVHAFEPFDQERALRVGADQHLTKPFQSIRGLVATVKEMIATPASQAAYSAAVSSAPIPAPEPISIPACAESDFASLDAEVAFTATGAENSLAATEAATVAPDLTPLEPGFTPLETETGFTSVDTAPFIFSTQADQDEGEVLEQAADDHPVASEGESFFPQLTLESPIVAQPEPTTPENEVSLTVAEEPLEFDAASALYLPTETEFADMLSDSTTAPLADAAEIEGPGEVLDLDDESLSTIESDEIELLPEMAPTLQSTAETTVATEQVNCEPILNDSGSSETTCEPFFETPTSTDTGVADTLPILAEFETPVSSLAEPTELELGETEMMSLESCQTEVESDVFAEADTQPLPEPDAVLESTFTPASDMLNGDRHDSGIGEASLLCAEPEAVKQDASIGLENAPAASFDLQAIPPALIDEIVKRVVERLSEKAIQEIAWEVVPEMAELLLRRQLAEAEKVSH